MIHISLHTLLTRDKHRYPTLASPISFKEGEDVEVTLHPPLLEGIYEKSVSYHFLGVLLEGYP